MGYARREFDIDAIVKMKLAWKLAAGTGLGFAAIAACAGAPPQNVGSTPGDDLVHRDAEEEARRASRDAGGGSVDLDAGAPADAGPKCPFGALEDPHRGFVRCLSENERDAGWLPPPVQVGSSEGDAGPGKDNAPAATGAAPTVEVGTPKFDNGDVPKLDKVLAKTANDVAQCVAGNGGLSGASGSIKLQFLVRPRGRAEGVEVNGAKGVSDAAQGCVRTLFKNKAVGAPTADPTGVTVTFTLKAAK